MTLVQTPSSPPGERGPAWDIARLFPNQGHWSEGDYLLLNRQTNRLVELSEGEVEVLPMPSLSHQDMVLHLRDALRAFVKPKHLGRVTVAPYPVRLWAGKFREPDVVFLLAPNVSRMGEDFADGADIVMEVVSDDRRRDLEVKREEYARGGIAEYWIVDPRERQITVLKLGARRRSRKSVSGPVAGKGRSRAYITHGEFGPGERATSALLNGLAVDVDQVFDAGIAGS